VGHWLQPANTFKSPTTRYIKWKEEDMSKKANRDVEKSYPLSDFISKLRRLADSLEKGEQFEIQVAGERIYVPARATYNIEHERENGEEEIEFQIKWSEVPPHTKHDKG